MVEFEEHVREEYKRIPKIVYPHRLLERKTIQLDWTYGDAVPSIESSSPCMAGDSPDNDREDDENYTYRDGNDSDEDTIMSDIDSSASHTSSDNLGAKETALTWSEGLALQEDPFCKGHGMHIPIEDEGIILNRAVGSYLIPCCDPEAEKAQLPSLGEDGAGTLDIDLCPGSRGLIAVFSDGSIDFKDAAYSTFEPALSFPMIKSKPLKFEGLKVNEKPLRQAKSRASYWPEFFNNGGGREISINGCTI